MFKFETTNDIYLLTNYLALGNEGAVIEKAQEIVEREMKCDRSDDSFTSLGKAHYFEPVHLTKLKSFQDYLRHLRNEYLDGKFIETVRDEYEVQLFSLHNFLFELSVMSEKATKQTWCALAMRGDIANHPEAVEESLAEYYADKAMLDLQEDLALEDRLARKLEIEAKINKVRNEVFSGIVVSGEWNEAMKKGYTDLLLSPNVDAPTKLLILSAVTIACVHLFDYEKFTFLVDMYLHAGNDSLFRSRAVVGILFGTKNMPGLYINKVRKLLKDVMAKDEKLMSWLMKAAKVEFHARNIDEGEDVFQRQFSRIMFKKMKSALAEEDEKEGFYDNDDDDDDDEFDEEEEGIKEVMDFMGKGTDVYYSQFKKMKKAAFFHSVYNWFMPFYYESEVYLKMQKKLGEKLTPVLKFFFQKSTLCDNDRYSFAYMVVESKSDLYKMFEQISQDMEQVNIDGESVTNGDPILGEIDDLHALIFYMQSLSRFFDLAPMNGEFDDPFAETESYEYEPPLAFPVFDEPCFDKERIKLARYFFRHNGCSLVPAVMPKKMPDTEECHFMMGYSLFNYDPHNIKYAVKALPHVEWLMKYGGNNANFIELAAYVYDAINLTDKVEECWQKMLATSEDEETRLLAKRNLAIFYSTEKKFEQADKLLYELYYQDPSEAVYVVMLARNLFMEKPGDMANVDKAQDLLVRFMEQNAPQTFKDMLRLNLGDEDDEPKSLKNMFASLIDTVQDFIQEDHSMDYSLSFYLALCQWVKGNFDEEVLGNLTDSYVNRATEEYGQDHVYYIPMLGGDMRHCLKAFGKTDADIAIIEEILRESHNKLVEQTKRLVGGLGDDMRKGKDNGKLE